MEGERRGRALRQRKGEEDQGGLRSVSGRQIQGSSLPQTHSPGPTLGAVLWRPAAHPDHDGSPLPLMAHTDWRPGMRGDLEQTPSTSAPNLAAALNQECNHIRRMGLGQQHPPPSLRASSPFPEHDPTAPSHPIPTFCFSGQVGLTRGQLRGCG